MKSLSFLLTPDYMFNTYDEVTPEFLRSIGVRALLCDIDNTLAPYEQPEPDAANIAWFSSLKEAGISVSLISNNKRGRVELYNEKICVDAYFDSGKPAKKVLLMAMAKMGSDATNTAFLGDQLLTDALGAHKVGMRAIIVPPIKDKKTLFFKFKRWLEIPYIKKYRESQKDTEK